MRHSIKITVLLTMLLTMASQSVFAQSELIRSEKPVSVMLELSAGGPNGTVGTHVDYDFIDWAGVSVWVGYSGFSKSVNTSLMFNTRLFRGGSAHHEGSLQLSLGASYRGQSKETTSSFGWGTTETVSTADSTLFISSSIGYALAHKGGFRFHVYLGWDYPVYADNYDRYEIDEETGEKIDLKLFKDQNGNDVWVDQTPNEMTSIGAPTFGVSLGYSF